MTPHDWVWLIFITIFGAVVGSFLNVVIYRLPAGVSLINPLHSRCPHCETKLAAYDNVPVLGWLWLQGKCRTCKAPISIQYPLIEALTAAMFGGTYILFYLISGWRDPLGILGFELPQTYPILIVWLIMLAGLIAATMIDARHYIIPLGIPWFITITAFIGLPLGMAFDKPPWISVGRSIDTEPFVPIVGELGAMIAWGGAVGLVIANVLLRVGILPDSFEGEDDGALDENGELPPLKHPRKVALRELMFVGFPLLGMLVGHYVGSRGLIAQPEAINHAWYYVLAGSLLGYLVGGGLIWLIRIFGTLGFGKEAMGLGDVHLLGAIGAVLGWHESVFICIFLAPFLGLGITIVLKLLASVNKKLDQPVPYGPYLALGAVLLLFVGSDRIDIIDMYNHFMATPFAGPSSFLYPDVSAARPLCVLAAPERNSIMTTLNTLTRPLALLLIIIGLTSVGCHRSIAERDALMAQNIEAQNEINRLRQTVDALRAQADSVPGLEARIADLEAQIAQLQAQLAAKPVAPPRETGTTGFEGIDDVDAERRGNLVTVRVASDILFSSGKVALKNSSKATLNEVAGVLSSRYGSKTIRVEGYTDTDPIRKSGWKDNLELSLQRAAAVHRYLQTRGIDAGRMYAAGYGEEKPLGSKAASRRVEIVVVLSE